MAIEYEVEWDPKALKELRKLDGILVLAVGKRERSSVYEQAGKR